MSTVFIRPERPFRGGSVRRLLCSSGTALTFLAKTARLRVQERQGYRQTSPAAVGICSRYAAVVGDDDLLNQRQAETGPASLGREKWPENSVSQGGIDPRSVVGHAQAEDPGAVVSPFHHDLRRCGGAGFQRIAAQVAESLA